MNVKNNIYARYCNQYKMLTAQLSQRDRTAGYVVVFAKSRRLELGDNILQTL